MACVAAKYSEVGDDQTREISGGATVTGGNGGAPVARSAMLAQIGQ
jgi:hypothetical protein